MRGEDVQHTAMWSYVMPEDRIPTDHPLREIRSMANQALAEMSPMFATLYSLVGRPSIPPEGASWSVCKSDELPVAA